MTFALYPDGIGGADGDSLVSATVVMATKIIYCDSTTGSDSYDGVQRTKPKATLAGAYAVASNGSIIVLLSTHSETIATVVTVSAKNVTIIGEGVDGSGYPAAQLACNANIAITVSGDDCQIRNVKFLTSTTANSNPRVSVTGDRFSMIGCRVECTGTDANGVELGTGCDSPTIRDCTFISTSVAIASIPTYGLTITSGLDGLEIYDTVFSDGLYGFSSYAFSFVTNAVPNIRAENISLLLGAEMNVGTSYGYIHIGTSTGGGRVI